MVKGIGDEYEGRGMSEWSPSRRGILRALGTAAVAGTVPSVAASQNGSGATESWTEFAADPANTGFAPTNTGPVASREEQWRFETEEDVLSSPAVVAHGSVDGQDGPGGATVYVGSNDGTVYAIAADDGTERWGFPTGGKVSSSPAVVDGTVYVGSNDNRVYAIAADDGSERWRFETGGEVLSSPTVAGGAVYVGSNDNRVYAIAADDGSEV
ncbi:MAG: outer membrane protein assembly factor BamB, partial [Halobacteriales archaeon]